MTVLCNWEWGEGDQWGRGWDGSSRLKKMTCLLDLCRYLLISFFCDFLYTWCGELGVGHQPYSVYSYVYQLCVGYSAK